MDIKQSNIATPLENLLEELRMKLIDGIGCDPFELERYIPIIRAAVKLERANKKTEGR